MVLIRHMFRLIYKLVDRFSAILLILYTDRFILYFRNILKIFCKGYFCPLSFNEINLKINKSINTYSYTNYNHWCTNFVVWVIQNPIWNTCFSVFIRQVFLLKNNRLVFADHTYEIYSCKICSCHHVYLAKNDLCSNNSWASRVQAHFR